MSQEFRNQNQWNAVSIPGNCPCMAELMWMHRFWNISAAVSCLVSVFFQKCRNSIGRHCASLLVNDCIEKVILSISLPLRRCRLFLTKRNRTRRNQMDEQEKEIEEILRTFDKAPSPSSENSVQSHFSAIGGIYD